MHERHEPRLGGSTTPSDNLTVPKRSRSSPSPRPTRGRKRRPLLRLLFWLLLIALALTVLPVALLRWIPPPTTAFMLQSDTTPVRYRWVARDKIAETARRAVVAAEDQKFWDHKGFDLEAIEKAYAHNQKSRRKRGASTISQQTAKNLFLWSGGGYFRKGLEVGYTLLIETLWPKQRILEVYLNIAEFGPGIYGVEAAAQAYFKKPAKALSASEAARLAAVLPSPRRWSVLNPGSYVQSRSNWILGQMGYGRRPTVVEEPELPPEMERDLDPADLTDSLPAPEAEPAVPAETIAQAAPADLAPEPAPPDQAPALPEEPAPANATPDEPAAAAPP